MRVLIALAALLGAALPASGQAPSETAFDLVRLDPSARAAALAGAGAVRGDDPTAAFYNPALLTSDMDGALALGYTNHVADVSAGAASYARDLGLWGGLSVGAGVRFLSYGEFDRRTGAGDDAVLGTYGASEAAVTLSAAREVLPQLRLGANVHALFASLDEASAQALVADLGLALSVPEEALTIGASVHHVGVLLSSLGETDDRLPLDLRVTVSKRLEYLPLTVSLSGVDLQSFDGPEVDSSLVNRTLDHVALGGELQLGRTLAVRAGYNGRRGDALRSGSRLDLAGVSVGAGIKLRRVTVDYAFSNWGDFGGLHQFGVRTRL
ncbi:MAG: PorV/PorQ family protein [Bacteroidota bacterium]